MSADEIEQRRVRRPARGVYAAGLLLSLLTCLGIIGWLVGVAVHDSHNDATWLIFPALFAAIGCVRRLGWLAGIHEDD